MPIAEPSLILDTHVWLWLANGKTELAETTWDDLLQGIPPKRLLVSAISTWEVAMLEAKGRISLSEPVGRWVEAALSLPGIALLPLSPAIAVESSRLPGAFHGDHANRILVASARLTDAPLVTRDAAIVDYGRQGYVRVIGV